MHTLAPDLVTQITHLVAKGRAAQAQSIDDIDWTPPARTPIFLAGKRYRDLIAQFHHGEVAAGEICAVVRDRGVGADAHAFLLTQEMDERRHAAIYGRYLEKLYPGEMPPSILAVCYDRIKGWEGPHEALILACHVILEGRYLKLQANIPRWMRCGLFREVSERIARDEARHFAFGRLYLSAQLRRLPRAERLAMADWLRALWEDACSRMAAAFAPAGGIGLRLRHDRWMALQWQHILQELETVGLLAAGERWEVSLS